MTTTSPTSIAPAEGKLGVLCVGLGAVTSTLIAGVELARRGMGEPIGSLTQLGAIRLGTRTEHRVPLIRDFVPLADLDDLVFGAWDVFPDDAYVSASRAGVLDTGRHLEAIGDALRAVRPMPAAFDPAYVKRLDGADVEAFEQAIDTDDAQIAPSMLYAYAALQEGIPFANGAPNLTVDVPALRDYATEHGVPIAGKDFKTGQTLIKTVIAPMLKARMLGLSGWYSTNILGNRDGEVLDDPESFRTKEESKLGVLEEVLEPDRFPQLYGDVYHKVRINYYPPRGDNKEGWDNVDLFGWLGYPMQLKIDFMCRDSILAAPLALDLCLFLDLAQRAGLGGIQEWLSFYFKSPQVGPGLYPEHDLFIQQTKLKNTLRWMMGEEQITHLGMDYYLEE